MSYYEQEKPVSFLNSQGWEFRKKSGELVTGCPFCKKPSHLYMNPETGVWKCQRCGESGNLRQLREKLGLERWKGNGRRDGIQSFGQALKKAPPKRIPRERVDRLHTVFLLDQEAGDYATSTRGWSTEVVERFKLGLRQDARGKWLCFPWWRRGECVGMKYRILPAYQESYPQRFEREAGCESVLFNADALESHQEIILASGESDALSLLTLGFENVVATTTGESSLPAAAVDALSKKPRVLIPYDNDAAGQKGAREVGKRIGYERTYLVQLPERTKDVNEFLTRGGTREKFQSLLDAAAQFDVPSVLSLSQALDKLEEEKTFGSWDRLEEMTPWPTVNRKLGQWRPGNLVVLSGPQGTGKTTWALNLATFWAAKGYPALVYCLEMSVEELVQHVLCSHYRKEEEEITREVIAKAREDLAEWPLYLGANPSATGRKEVMGILTQAVRRYGLKLLVFDNLHLLSRSVDHRAEEVGVLSKCFKQLAMELQIPVILIAQPRKLEPGQIMSPWDLKDSVDIFSDADQIIILHRELIGESKGGKAVAAAGSGSGENWDPQTLVRLAKARHRASRDSLLYCEGAQHRFREPGPEEVRAEKRA